MWQKDVLKELLPEILERWKGEGVKIDPGMEAKLSECIEKMGNYIPRIGFFGKTGSGKSELCNAIFGQEVAKVDEIEACTRQPNEYFVKLSKNKGICLVDVPGIGESSVRHEEYSALYKKLVSSGTPLDAVLWVLKADDKAYVAEEDTWKKVIVPCIQKDLPVIIVLNQVDKFNPLNWNQEANEPSAEQAEKISTKTVAVSNQFSVEDRRVPVIPTSAFRRFGMIELVDALISALPNEKKLKVLEFTRVENQSDKAKEEASRGWAQFLMQILSKSGMVVGKFVVDNSEKIIEVGGKIILAMILGGRRGK